MILTIDFIIYLIIKSLLKYKIINISIDFIEQYYFLFFKFNNDYFKKLIY
jgi:hypothetical protein